MIDIVMPTMWVNEDRILQRLESYTRSEFVSNVIVISNAKRPKSKILEHHKVKLIDYGRNIYVNPAWNEGYYRSSSPILALVNDDIDVQDGVFRMVTDFGLREGDLIGVDLRGYANNYVIDEHIDFPEGIVQLEVDRSRDIGGQAWAFGICMFMLRSSYRPIPSLFQVWYGDDFLVQNAERVLVLRTNMIKGAISETLVKHDKPGSDIRNRRVLDTQNYQKYRLSLEYDNHRRNKSDINTHLEILRSLASQCDHVTEFGVRRGSSTRAFLASKARKLVSYDIEKNSDVEKLFQAARKIGRDAAYIQADVLKIRIEKTDMLFIDTLHCYDQLRKELALHAPQVSKYIAFHDTHTFGTRGELDGDDLGLLPAIIEFCINNPEWRFKVYRTNNNGLTVIERTE